MINETLKTLKTTYKKESRKMVRHVTTTLKRMLHYHVQYVMKTLCVGKKIYHGVVQFIHSIKVL